MTLGPKQDAYCIACGRGCTHCRGVHANTGEATILISLTVEQLVDYAHCTRDLDLRERLLRAISLIDPAREQQTRDEILS